MNNKEIAKWMKMIAKIIETIADTIDKTGNDDTTEDKE